MKPRKYICPFCRKKTAVGIIYGLPNYALWEKAELGEIVLGGCGWHVDNPDRACLICKRRWLTKRGEIVQTRFFRQLFAHSQTPRGNEQHKDKTNRYGKEH